MNVACPECSAVYRIDPTRVPEDGVTTRCRSCNTLFRVDPGREIRAGAVVTGAPVEAGGEPEPGGAATAVAAPGAPRRPERPGAPERPAPAFGPQDPDTRARRLARALVSDIKVYNADKWRECREAGTLRKEFRSEIMKSWEEYVEQVGQEMAKRTPYFRDALNAILAEGESVF